MISRLLENPGVSGEISKSQIPALLGQLESLKASLWAKLLAPEAVESGESQDGDQLLTVQQAASRLGTSKDWLYRHCAKLPFTVRPSPHQLRFSKRGIAKYISQRMGR